MPLASSAWDLYLLLCVAASLTDAATKLCEDGWDHNGAFCYYFSDPGDTQTPKDSVHECLMHDAQFAWPQTKSELDYLRKNAKGGNAYGWLINIGFDTYENATRYFDVGSNTYKAKTLDFLPQSADNFDLDEDCVAYSLSRRWHGYIKNGHWFETVRCSAFLRSACVGDKSDMKDQVIDQDKWFEHGEKVYWVKSLLTSYKEAKSLCESRSMTLLDDPSGLYGALGDKKFDGTPFWASVQLKNGVPYWRNGSAADPPAFRWKRPNYAGSEDYVLLSSGKVKVRATYGINALPYVCKKRTAFYGRLGCPNIWTRGGRSCYLFGNKELSWQQAKSACESRGAHLLTVNSETEALWLRSSILGSYYTVWTSANDLDNEGTFVWHDGTKTNDKIFPWSDGNVNLVAHSCAVLDVWSSAFQAFHCTSTAQAACQYTVAKDEICAAGWHLYKSTCYWFDTLDVHLSFSVYKKVNKKRCLANVDGVETHRIRQLEVRSDDVMDFIKRKVEYGMFWLGLQSAEVNGEFMWQNDGTIYSGNYFDKIKEPNNGGQNSNQPQNCASISRFGYARDYQCSDKFQFICEKELPGGSEQNGATINRVPSYFFTLLLAGWLSYFLHTRKAGS